MIDGAIKRGGTKTKKEDWNIRVAVESIVIARKNETERSTRRNIQEAKEDKLKDWEMTETYQPQTGSNAKRNCVRRDFGFKAHKRCAK